MQASQGLFMSHPFPPHERGGEGVGQAKGRGRVKPPPEQSLRRLLLVEIRELMLEETAVPCLRKEIGRPSEEGAGSPKFLRWALDKVLGTHLALKLFDLFLSGFLGLKFEDTSRTFRLLRLRKA